MNQPLDDPRRGAIADAVGILRQRLDSHGGAGVRILAVAKGFPWSDVRAVMDAGVDIVGENYAQEIAEKYSPVASQDRPRIHFIGRLQSNKIGQLSPYVTVWQSVDRVRLLEGIARRAAGSDVMVQVNTTGEPGKGGCPPGDVGPLVERGRALGLNVIGLMVVGPTSGDREQIRSAFSHAARLRADLGLVELSMGMSDDLELAVEMGSTMVRVGSALFGSRPPKS